MIHGMRDEQASGALEQLDQMLDEIDAHWRTNDQHIPLPAARPGFSVAEDNGLPWLVAQVELPLIEAAVRVERRAARNPADRLYANHPGERARERPSHEPIVLPLNDSLLVVLVPDLGDPALLGRVVVAMP